MKQRHCLMAILSCSKVDLRMLVNEGTIEKMLDFIEIWKGQDQKMNNYEVEYELVVGKLRVYFY